MINFKIIFNTILLTSSLLNIEPLFASASLPSETKLIKLSGGSVGLKDVKGKPAVIEFWASWCQSCGPSMQNLSRWADKNSKVGFYPVSVDETMEEAKSFFDVGSSEFKKLKSRAYFDKDAILAETINVEALPATMVVNSKGQIVATFTGKVDQAKIKKIEAALKKAK